jgi:2,4-diketo-3-deoxy-L-fuconate hydrolase
MKLVTYSAADGRQRPGAVRGGDVVDLSRVVDGILELVELGRDGLERAREQTDRGPAFARLDEVRLHAPIPVPRRHLYCVGWNYPRHYDEGVGRRAGQETEERNWPAFFTKPPAAVVGPGEAIAYDPAITERLDYEAELALVLGGAGRSIPEERALEHIFGYTLANDVSARDVQRRHGGQWLKGKGMDTYCPLGPVLVTPDELDVESLILRCTVNGELRQEASVGSMVFPISTLVAELSFGMSVVPGDILLTGTPTGVGFAREPPVFLGPGDVVAVEIAEIGRLENPVVAQALT